MIYDKNDRAETVCACMTICNFELPGSSDHDCKIHKDSVGVQIDQRLEQKVKTNVSFNSYPNHPPGIQGVNKICLHKCLGAGKNFLTNARGREKFTDKCSGARNFALNLSIEI